jgi:hypothetical protein
MIGGEDIVLNPLVPILVLWALMGLAALGVALASWRGLLGWWLRGLAACAILAALANPSLQSEDAAPLSDIALILVDDSASNQIGDRAIQSATAVTDLSRQIAALGGVETRVVHLGDGPRNTGTRLNSALVEALADIPRDRLSGAFVISDGQGHDGDVAVNLPAPLHLLQTGLESDWDRRLIVRNAPAFAILNESIVLTLRVDDQGRVPEDVAGRAQLSMSLNGAPPRVVNAPVGQDLQLTVTLDRGGMNVLQFELTDSPGELTRRNNTAVVQVNGVRDRLSVLLVSGEPNAGQRTWRNLLKSDPSVDLVHFTILRPPDRQDGVPVDELSLIAFPTQELFVDKIDEFDLIIFDRYRRRGILPNSYFENIRRYVETGGALLVVGGPELAGAESIWRSPLGAAFPAAPSARVLEQGFTPRVTALGNRHPVTEGLENFAPLTEDGLPAWGRWMRQVELTRDRGQVVMEGIGDRPLLVLDRYGDGRVALLASDQAWLWDRGFEGGGPQLELLRRLAHWMMAEPELEEEALLAAAEGQHVTVSRRTLSDTVADVSITAPDGTETFLSLTETDPGLFVAEWDAPEIGLYRLTDGLIEAVVALGPTAPREFAAPIATAEILAPEITVTRGGVMRIEDGMPDLRQVLDGRAAAGRGWLGIVRRDAFVTTDLRIVALLPAWIWLLLAASLALAAWLREGRR